MKLISFLCPGLLLLSAVTYAQTQRSSFSTQLQGSGTISRSGSSAEKLNKVEFSLNRDRSAVVSFIGNRRLTYSGTWNTSGREDYVITIRRAYGDSDARGEVFIDMKGDRVEKLDVKNGRADDSRFSGNFRVDRGGDWNDTWGGISISGARRGDGSFVAPGQRARDFEQFSFNFNQLGYFSLGLQGGSNITGRYRRDSNNRLVLEIERAFNISDGSGTGVVDLKSNGRDIQSFRLSGRVSRGSYSAQWEDRRSDNDDDDFNREQFKIDSRGTGDGRNDNVSWAITRATGDFRRDGKFNMTVYSYDERIPVEGKWHHRDRDTVVLEITRFRGRSASGSGTLERDYRGGASSFYFGGSANGRFSFNFRQQLMEPR